MELMYVQWNPTDTPGSQLLVSNAKPQPDTQRKFSKHIAFSRLPPSLLQVLTFNNSAKITFSTVVYNRDFHVYYCFVFIFIALGLWQTFSRGHRKIQTSQAGVDYMCHLELSHLLSITKLLGGNASKGVIKLDLPDTQQA